jgi:hypothetical protein
MTQTLYILLGMAIFYFSFSSRFRKFVKKAINSWTRKNNALTAQELSTEIIRPARAAQVSRLTRKKSPEMNGAGQLEIDETDLAEYLQNPDVKVRE